MATLADDMETDRTIPSKTFVITLDDGWSDGYTYAFPIMRQYGFVATFYVVADRIDRRPDFLSTPQLQALESAGNDIGNHTWDHLSLTSLSLASAYGQVEAASERIAAVVGHRPVSLAYPMGDVSEAVAETVSEVPDLKLAVHTGFGTYETWFARYWMPRVRIHPGTSPDQLLAWLND
jgi:peptidoglycan/xylan/chitin deacetylase (PgdA/CDA1 family)